jgi:hypothetical protein
MATFVCLLMHRDTWHGKLRACTRQRLCACSMEGDAGHCNAAVAPLEFAGHGLLDSSRACKLRVGAAWVPGVAVACRCVAIIVVS